LERGQHGVEPTVHGRALLHCAAAVFDDLREGVRNIEFLSDPTLGEVRLGGHEAIIAGLVATLIGRLRHQYPGVTVHMTHIWPPQQQYRELRERRIDLVLGRLAPDLEMEKDLEAEVLYHDRIVVVAGFHARWTARRKIDLAELAQEPWGLPPSDTLAGALIQQAFGASGVSVRGAVTGSPQLLLSLLSKGPFLATVPESMLKFEANLPPLKVLPVELPASSWPVGVITLKKRAISPVAQLFLETVREVARAMHPKNAGPAEVDVGGAGRSSGRKHS
jgi:DNA-binding transcriptional LysR family regulator